ncbi:hypothetical protein ACHAXR_002682 [Thalassiosira sp. AJA248-18]
MSAPPAFTLHTSFSSLISLYDTFLLDQFGVIHNGSQSLHGAADCIRSMLEREKRLAILSNTSSPSHVALKRLKKYGLRDDMFAGGLVSSGEECAKFVRENYYGGDEKKNKALWITWKESETQNPLQFISYCESGNADDNLVGVGKGGVIDVAESVDDADFILLHGSEVWRRCRELPASNKEDDMIQDLNFLYNQDFSIIDPILALALQRNLPLVCANPDLIVGLPGGRVGNMPVVMWQLNKNYDLNFCREDCPAICRKGRNSPSFWQAQSATFSCLPRQPWHRLDVNAKSIPGVLHVGDSLEHDVAGANAAGIDSVFVLGGIHARELGLIPTGSEDVGIVIVDDDDDIGGQDAPCITITKKELTTKLQSFFEEKNTWPSHVVPSLSLGRKDSMVV